MNVRNVTRPRAGYHHQRALGADLTLREIEVAQLVALGLSNRRIAERLIIGQRTAETHVAHLMSKLAVATRAQVAVWATEHRAAIARITEAVRSNARLGSESPLVPHSILN